MRGLVVSRKTFLMLQVAVVLTLGLYGCNAYLEPPAAAAQSVTLMTFNVENLFDTEDDAGKNDATYLPLDRKQDDAHRAGCNAITVQRWRDQCLYWDWSEQVLEQKLRVVADAILQLNNGRGPDLVVLQEIENMRVLERLRRDYLAAAGYRPAILLEGRDLRGIDVAFLSRLPLALEPVLHQIPFTGFERRRVEDTRGILEATFSLPDGHLLTGYAVHFPAPYHPREMREQAFAYLNKLRAALPPDRYVFAAGDFNTTAVEDREHEVFEGLAARDWLVAHRHCEPCDGTHYYAPNDSWSFLDTIIFSAPTTGVAAWQLDTDSVRIVNGLPAHVTAAGTPASFELPEATGVSDHWPLAVTLRQNAP